MQQPSPSDDRGPSVVLRRLRELERQSAELSLKEVNAGSERRLLEMTRQLAELERQSAELDRQSAEMKRQSAELSLKEINAELSLKEVNAGSERRLLEMKRQLAELERQLAELEIQSAELEIQSAELSLKEVNAELEIQSAELSLKEVNAELDTWLDVAKSGRNGNRLKTDVISKTRHSAGCRECKGKRRTGNYPFKKCSHPKEFQHVTKQLKRIRTNQKAMREELISEYRASRCSTQDHPPTVPADLLSDAQQQEPVAPGTPAPPPVVPIEQPPPSVPYIADEQPGPSNAATARSATDRPINPVPPTFVQPPNLPATVEAVQEVGAEMDIMDE